MAFFKMLPVFGPTILAGATAVFKQVARLWAQVPPGMLEAFDTQGAFQAALVGTVMILILSL